VGVRIIFDIAVYFDTKSYFIKGQIFSVFSLQKIVYFCRV